jgi:poly-beta-1,6-N-acetyl-D-glucosamine synthase
MSSASTMSKVAPEVEPRVADPALRIVCVVPFLNEELHLRAFMDSLARQDRFPDLLVLVDDGSTDASLMIASEFVAAHANIRLVSGDPRPAECDRLADAAELRSFRRGLSEVREPWDVAVKLDADLELGPDLFATLEHAFLATPDLGIAGAHLSVVDPQSGVRVRERCLPHHVRGATKFYRRACLEEISPIPPILGWDTIDEITARKQGWQTGSFACAGGDTVHLRPIGSVDGRLRAHYRWGSCAYGIGQHPLWVVLSAARRLSDRPRLLGSAAFVVGWASAAVCRRPRAASDVRAFGRREQLFIMRRVVQRMLSA